MPAPSARTICWPRARKTGQEDHSAELVGAGGDLYTDQGFPKAAQNWPLKRCSKRATRGEQGVARGRGHPIVKMIGRPSAHSLKRTRGADDEKSKAVAEPGGSSSGGSCGGPSRVLLLRHGQSETNATQRDMPDPPLTKLGRVQASAWKGAIGRFGAEAVLVSPLRRALETALLAYDQVDVPIVVCRHARELGWGEQANTPSTPEALEAVLRNLPRGDEVLPCL